GLPQTPLGSASVSSAKRFRDCRRTFLTFKPPSLTCLPDRFHRCEFRRAAESSTSRRNVLRCLCTHRIMLSVRYRQLTEKGLSPFQVCGLVGCSGALPHQLRSYAKLLSQFCSWH